MPAPWANGRNQTVDASSIATVSLARSTTRGLNYLADQAGGDVLGLLAGNRDRRAQGRNWVLRPAVCNPARGSSLSAVNEYRPRNSEVSTHTAEDIGLLR